MQRNNFIDIIKGILITLVCIGHTNQYIVNLNSDFWGDPLFKAIYTFHMPLFMAVAGYLSFRGITNASKVQKYIVHRSTSLLIPIFVWAALEQVARSSLVGDPSIQELPISILEGGYHSLWFLWALLGSIAITAVAHAAGNYRATILIILFTFTFFLPDTSPIYLFKYTFPFFVIGFYATRIDFHTYTNKKINILTIIFLLASIICILLWQDNTYIYVTKMTLSYDNIFNIIFRWIAGIVISIFIVLLLFRIKHIFPEKLNNVLILAGKNSIYIYIIQTYAFLIIDKLSQKLLHPINNVIIGDLLSIIIGIVITYFCLFAGMIMSKNKYCDKYLFGRK